MRKRYGEVHQRHMEHTVPVYFALGWIAEERHGLEAIDWATFACWRSNFHDGPFEMLHERESRIAEENRKQVMCGGRKFRGRPSREARGNVRASNETSESAEADLDSDEHYDPILSTIKPTSANDRGKKMTILQRRIQPRRLCVSRIIPSTTETAPLSDKSFSEDEDGDKIMKDGCEHVSSPRSLNNQFDDPVMVGANHWDVDDDAMYEPPKNTQEEDGDTSDQLLSVEGLDGGTSRFNPQEGDKSDRDKIEQGAVPKDHHGSPSPLVRGEVDFHSQKDTLNPTDNAVGEYLTESSEREENDNKAKKGHKSDGQGDEGSAHTDEQLADNKWEGRCATDLEAKGVEARHCGEKVKK